jgi:large subunit ribosomal protein L25
MDLTATMREKFGKATKALRREGTIPAELYGRGLKNIHLVVPQKEFNKAYKEAGANTVVNLLVNKEKHPALIYDVNRDYLTDEVSHIDFYQVRMDEKIKAKIPLEFTGESAAVKEKAAILNKAMVEIEVEALPADLPHRISVDLSVLDDLNKSVYVKNLHIAKGVKVLVDQETVIVTATPPVKEEEKVVAEAPVDVTEVKVESEEKKVERATEKAEKAKKEEAK